MVNTDINQIIFKGEETQGPFPFSFKIFDRTDLKLIRVDAAGNEAAVLTDYFVDMVTQTVYYPGYAPGAVEPKSDRPLPLQPGERLVIYRDVPITQMCDFPEQWPWDMDEVAHDKSCVVDQQLKGDVDRAFKVSRLNAGNFEGTFPVAPNKSIKFNAEGTGFVLTEDPADVLPAVQSAKDEVIAAKERVEELVEGVGARYYNNVAELEVADLAVGDIAVLLGYKDFNDGGANTYVVRDARVEKNSSGVDKVVETKSEPAVLIKLKNGRVAELVQDYKVKNDGYHVPWHNGDGVVNEMLECALSYLKAYEAGGLGYNHVYCAYNDAFPPTAKTKNIDCITFCQLVTNGVPYEMSQYALLDKNYSKFDWGYDWNDFYVGRKGYQYLVVDGVGRGRMLANDMLVYCENKGWAFHVAEDYSNLEPGDLLFFFGKSHVDDADYYKDVGHVAMFLWRNGRNECTVAESVSSEAVVRIKSGRAMGSCIMAARIPLGIKKKANVKNLFTDEAEAVGKSYVNKKIANVGTYHFKGGLKPNSFYTFVGSIDQDPTQNDGDSTQTISLAFPSGSNFERWRQKKTLADNLYVAHWFVDKDGVIINGDVTPSSAGKTSINIILYNVNSSGSFISGGVTQVNTVCNFVGLFEGLVEPGNVRVPYEPEYEGIDTPIPYKALTLYELDDSNVMSTINSLHTNAINYCEYSCVLRCINVTSAVNEALAGKVWYLKGFRHSSATYGWQMFIPYSPAAEPLMRKRNSSSWGSIEPLVVKDTSVTPSEPTPTDVI